MMRNKILSWVLILLAGLILLFALQYTVLTVQSVRKLYTTVSISETNLAGVNAQDTTWLNLYRQKNWLESRLKMAQSDSIYLTINLQDSTLEIELKGVVLKASSIRKLKYDNFFDELSPGAYHHYFGKEAIGKYTLATIDKIPLTVKKAPKDSIEFAAQSQIIDSTFNEEVNWLMELDNGIQLKIRGIDPSAENTSRTNSFWRKQKMEQLKSNLSKTIAFKVPVYSPSIEIEVDEADAKSIYRALPNQPMVSIRL